MDDSLLFMIILVPLIALAAWLMEWTLAPLIAAGRSSTTQHRFMLTDLLWLVVQLQLAMALIARSLPENASNSARWWGLFALCLPVIVFWFASLQAVSQAGIIQPLRRAAVFIVVLPGSIATFVGVPVLLGYLVFAILDAGANRSDRGDDLGVAAMEVILGMAGAVVVRNVACWSVATPAAANGQ